MCEFNCASYALLLQVSLADVVNSHHYSGCQLLNGEGEPVRMPPLTVEDFRQMGEAQQEDDVLDASTYDNKRPNCPALMHDYLPSSRFAIEGQHSKDIDGNDNPRDLFGKPGDTIGKWQAQAEACFLALLGTKERAFQSEFSWMAEPAISHRTRSDQRVNWQAAIRCVRCSLVLSLP